MIYHNIFINLSLYAQEWRFSSKRSSSILYTVYCIFSRFRFHADQSFGNRPEPFLPGAWRVAFSKSGRRGVVTLCLAVTSIDLRGATVWMGYNHLTLNPGNANLRPSPVLHTLPSLSVCTRLRFMWVVSSFRTTCLRVLIPKEREKVLFHFLFRAWPVF